jgi:hypothetical protein
MGIAAATATLTGKYARIHPGDTALIHEDPDALKAALERYHETGDYAILKPFVKSGEKPTVFYLRHLRGRAAVELNATLSPTAGVDGAITDRTIVALAHLCIADVSDWDGVDAEGKARPLLFHAHDVYPFRVLTDESFDDLCDVADGELVGWLGGEAWAARNLSPK